MATLVQDVKYAARTLARAPGFVAVVILTLAVGVGATTAIFSVVRGVLLRPLAYREPDRLVRVFDHWNQFHRASISVPEVVDYRAQADSLEGLSAYTATSMSLTGDGEPARVVVSFGQSNFFQVLGVAPSLGRGFAPEEDQPGHEHVVLLTDALWRNRYNADRSIVGRKLRLDDKTYEVIGVLPASFAFPGGYDLWAPLAFAPDRFTEERRGNHNLRVMARLKPGVTVAQAQAEFDQIGQRLRNLHPRFYPSDSGWNPLVVPLLEQIVGDVRPSLWLLVGAAALVLLIACANVANLLLARGATRVREMSLRAALGAGRGRLVRQLLTESLALSLVGGFCGFVLALWGVDLLLALAPSSLPRVGEVKVDGLVLAFSIGLTALTGVLFGLLPALQTSRVDLHDALRGAGRVSSGKRPRRIRRTLVIAEVALAIVLVTGAGLITKSFANVLSVDAGFPVDHLLTLRVTLPISHEQPTPEEQARYVRYFTDAVDRLGHIPGVRASGAIDVLPFEAYGSDNNFVIEGRPVPPGAMPPDEEIRVVLPGAFEALGVPLLAGRTVAAPDQKDGMPVLVVNEAFARKFWKDGDAVGKRISLDDKQPTWVTIVGVVGNVHAFGLDADVRPEMYFPMAQQSTSRSFSLLLRSTVPETELTGSVRHELLALDSGAPVYDMKPMLTVVGQSLERRRFVLVLFELFGGLALILAAIGLYGIMAQSVAQRTHEIGVRVALGARRGHVVRLVAREGLFLTGSGLLVGGVVALAATRVLGGLLYHVSPSDPVALIAAGLLLAGAAALATLVPVRRALRVDPMRALRDE